VDEKTALTAAGGFCVPHELLASGGLCKSMSLKWRRLEPLTAEEVAAAIVAREAENARRAETITVTMTVGEWEDMQDAAIWG
jgi:hypothetical protein